MWKYRILGQDFGPVSREALLDLLRDGTLGPSDIVCQNGDDWQLIESYPELLSAAEEDPDAEPAELSDDLTALLESVGNIDETASRNQSAATEEGWYCRVFGTELGPIDFDHLLSMVQDGELSRSDEVRLGGQGRWERADSIVGLFSVADSTPQSSEEDETTADVWYIERRGTAQGPYTFEELKQLAQTEILGERDRVREGRNGRWQRAATLVGLFDHRLSSRSIAGHATLSAQAIQAEKERLGGTNTPSKEFDQVTAPSPKGRGKKGRKRVSAEERWSNFFDPVDGNESKVASKDTAANLSVLAATTVTAPVTESPAVPTPAPVPSYTRPVQPAATTISLPPLAPPPAMTSPPAPAPVFVAPRKPKASWQMPSLGLGGLFGSLKDAAGGNAKQLIGLAVAAVALAGIYFGPSLFGGNAGQEHLAHVEQIWGRMEQLRETKADDNAWKALQAEVQPILDKAQEELAPVVAKYGREEPLAQHILWLVDSTAKNGPTKADGLFRKILAAGPNARDTELRTASSVLRGATHYAVKK